MGLGGGREDDHACVPAILCNLSLDLMTVLKGEIEISMRLLGVTRVDQLGPEYLNCERL